MADFSALMEKIAWQLRCEQWNSAGSFPLSPKKIGQFSNAFASLNGIAFDILRCFVSDFHAIFATIFLSLFQFILSFFTTTNLRSSARIRPLPQNKRTAFIL